MADDDWTGNWVAEKIRSCEGIASTEVLAPRLILVRRDTAPSFNVGTLAKKLAVDAAALRTVAEGNNVSFAVNVPRDCYYTGDALRYAAATGFAVGGLGDLMRAVSELNVTQYVPPTVAFIERGLRQHDRVTKFERLADLSYLVHRASPLPSIHTVFLHEYELVADHLRVARDRYGKFQIAVITNPNGNSTATANAVAKNFGCSIYKWGAFLGALNRHEHKNNS